MRIAYAFPVRHVETLKGGALAAIGIEHRVYTVAEFPAPVRVDLVVALAVPHVEARPDAQHALRARVLGPDLTELAPARAVTAQFGVSRDTPPGWEVRSTVALAARFTAPSEGAYSVELTTDNHSFDVQVLIRHRRAE